MESKTGTVATEKPRFHLVRSSCEVVTVTPEMALRWLSNNPHNRPIRAERVEELAERIRCGEWKPNPPVEVFDTGRLWNGQHRLSAIVRTGGKVQMKVLVWKKVPVEST